MASVDPIIVQTGVNAGVPFTLNGLTKVTNPGPPAQIASIATQDLIDSGSGVEYLSIPNAAGVYVTVTNAQETLRVNGGAIIQGAGTDSVQIGRGAAVVAGGTDQIVIGRGAFTAPQTAQGTVIIGATSNGSGGASVVIGFNSGSGVGNGIGGVYIGNTAQAAANGGGSNAVMIGDNAIAILGNAGGSGAVGIGFAVSIASPGCVVIGFSAQSLFVSAAGQASVVIGDSANGNKQGITIVGGSSQANGVNGTVFGSSSNANNTNCITIGAAALNRGANSILIGTSSTMINAQALAIGTNSQDLGPQVCQIGSSGTALNAFVLGAGNISTTLGPILFRFTNGDGTDYFAGDVTMVAPVSTGAATPAGWNFQTGVAGVSSGTLQTTATVFRLDGSTTAGQTRMLLYTVDTGTLQRVQTITNAAILTLLGLGAGRLLYVPA